VITHAVQVASRSIVGCVLTENVKLVVGMKSQIVRVLVLQAVSPQVQRLVRAPQVTQGQMSHIFARLATERVLLVQELPILIVILVLTVMLRWESAVSVSASRITMTVTLQLLKHELFALLLVKLEKEPLMVSALRVMIPMLRQRQSDQQLPQHVSETTTFITHPLYRW